MKRKRRRPEGHVWKRGRIWWFKWVDVTGRPHARSSGSTEIADAKTKLRNEIDRKAKGRAPSPNPRACLVDDLLEGLKARYRIEGRRSLDRLEDASEHVLRLFRGVPATTVIGADALRYADLRLKEGAANATINRELAALRAAYRLGVRNGLLEVAPHIRLLPENNARQGFAEPDQVDSICRHLPDDLADVVQFAAVTGWRKAEVLSLRWPQVEFNGGFVRLEPGTTKTGAGRIFPLIPQLRAVLERRREVTTRCERAQARVIPNVFHRSGRPVRSLRRAWRSACRKAGVPGLIFHDLRRSAVRNLERAGIPQSTAMELTGHRTAAVFRRYAIKDEAVLKEAGQMLAAWFSAADRATLSDNRRGSSVTVLGGRRGSD